MVGRSLTATHCRFGKMIVVIIMAVCIVDDAVNGREIPNSHSLQFGKMIVVIIISVCIVDDVVNGREIPDGHSL
jgi:hypothetical protein